MFHDLLNVHATSVIMEALIEGIDICQTYRYMAQKKIL